MRLGSVGEKSMWPIQSVEWKRILMWPGFSPLGPGSSRTVNMTTGMRAARRRSIMLPLSSDWTLAPPRVGLVEALALAGGGGGGALATKALGALGSWPGTSDSL